MDLEMLSLKNLVEEINTRFDMLSLKKVDVTAGCMASALGRCSPPGIVTRRAMASCRSWALLFIFTLCYFFLIQAERDTLTASGFSRALRRQLREGEFLVFHLDHTIEFFDNLMLLLIE